MKPRFFHVFLLFNALFCVGFSIAGDGEKPEGLEVWQKQAVDYARLMSEVQWTPVAEGIPVRGGKKEFQAGKTYQGLPYSNGGWDGRLIGFDIFLKTFLAAVENPQSVLYTKNLCNQRRNSAAFYGTVCSGYTSYALQTANQVGSSWHRPPHSKGIEAADPQSAQGASVRDILWFKGHVELVTEVTTDPDGTVSHICLEESWPPTTRTKHLKAEEFDKHLAKRKAILYHISDINAWRGENRAEDFLFPNYKEDAATPTINRVLLLDLGDWVVYRKGQPVVFNIMDRDNLGVTALVITHEGKEVEQIELEGPGIIQRAFEDPGDYEAHCIMKDGTSSQPCEFSVCELESSPVNDPIVLGTPLEIAFKTENMKAINVEITQKGDLDYNNPVIPYSVWLDDEDRSKGQVIIPANAISQTGEISVFVTGENRYGRLRNRHVAAVVKPE